MKNVKNTGHIYKPLMAGLFVAYFATLICIIFDVIFRQYTGFPLHVLINVSTLMFSILLLLPIAGCLFALIDKFFTKSTLIYEVLAIGTTLLLIYGVFQTHRSPDSLYSNEFHYLLLGVTLITGVGAMLIPYFVKHSEYFVTDYYS